jgi:hypothetical protein
VRLTARALHAFPVACSVCGAHQALHAGWSPERYAEAVDAWDAS